ncbi:hypothetical protein FBQ97_02730 [Acidobacteria bacterium ACD]|nr:hypothetical protein [Acidobacteria bacterium ACD]
MIACLVVAAYAQAGEPVYVPAFESTFWISSPSADYSKRWKSQALGVNPTAEVLRVTNTNVYVALGAAVPPLSGSGLLPPGSAEEVPLARGSLPVFNELDVPEGVVISAEVELVYTDGTCDGDVIPGGSMAVIPQGRAPLPVYRGLFPAGSTVVTNEISMGNPALPPTCATPNQRYLRRVNVTLFNGGDAPGTFVIRAMPRRRSATPLLETSVTLEPKEVRQVNRLPIPIVVDDTTKYIGGVSVWLTVTCDQPFVGYASALFDDPEPGALPFEVLEFKKGI